MTNHLSLNQTERQPIEQTNKSKELIQNLVTEANANLSAIVQQNMQFEQQRSAIVKTTKVNFEEQFNDLKQNVIDKVADVEELWEDVLNEEIPLELHDKIESQKQKMDAILKEKLDFIEELKKDVLMRDHEYVNRVAEQKERINQFIAKMREQEANLKKAIADELSKIEKAYKQEITSRTIQLDREIRDLSTKRQEKENALMTDILNTCISHREQLENLRRENSEKYNKTRTALEAKLQIAQKEQEDNKAQYIYSLTQLEYDYKILQETREEHINKIKLQEQKKTRQKDVFIRLREKYRKQEAEFTAINEAITKEYKRISTSYRELQSRFRNVAYNDFNNFREVWNMNEKRLHDLVLKIISADDVVMTQQLGKEPNVPDPDYLRRWIIGTDEYEDLTKTPELPQPETVTVQTRTETALTRPHISENLEHLRRMLVDEVGFLVDERVKNIIGIDPNSETDEDAQTIRMDVLLKELGITSEEDVETLIVYFVKEPEFNTLEKPELVSPHEVLEALRKFVDEYHPNRQQAQLNLFNTITHDATQNTSSEVARAILQLQSKMKKQLPAQRRFWEKKSSIVTEKMWRIWNSTFKGMQRYNQTLEQRAKLIRDTDALKQQNAELEVILENYLDAQDDTALIYPPGDTVNFYD